MEFTIQCLITNTTLLSMHMYQSTKKHGDELNRTYPHPSIGRPDSHD